LGISAIAQANYPPKTVEIDKAAQSIAKMYPDAVIIISRRHAAYNFILSAVNDGLTQTSFLGTSYLFPLQSMLKNTRGIDFLASSTVPDPLRSSLPIVDEYRSEMQKHFPNQLLSTISLFSYINASIFVEILKNISGIPTPDKIDRFIRGLKSYTFKGLTLDYDQEKGTLFDNLWISPKHRDAWIEVKKEVL